MTGCARFFYPGNFGFFFYLTVVFTLKCPILGQCCLDTYATLLIVRATFFREIMLSEKGINFFTTPKSMIHFSALILSDCGKFNYRVALELSLR